MKCPAPSHSFASTRRAALRLPQRHRIEQPVHHAALAPHHERVAGDALAGGARCAVVHEVDAGRGAVVLAGRMDGLRRAEAPLVVAERLRLHVGHALGAPAAELPVQVEARVAADHPLGQRVRLDQVEPVVVGRRERLVGALVHVQRGRDVDQRQPLHRARVVQRQPVRHARAAVVPGHEVALVAQASASSHAMSAAIARLLYSAWSSPPGGLSDSP